MEWGKIFRKGVLTYIKRLFVIGERVINGGLFAYHFCYILKSTNSVQHPLRFDKIKFYVLISSNGFLNYYFYLF
jgi:hypothetical protein